MTKCYLVTARDDRKFVCRLRGLDRTATVQVTATLNPESDGLPRRVVYRISTVAARNALDRMEGVCRVRRAAA